MVLKLEGFLDTDLRMVGTNVDLEFVDITFPIAEEDTIAGDGWAGGKTWTLSRCDTLNIWPDANGSIRGVDEDPEENICKYYFSVSNRTRNTSRTVIH